MSAETILVSAVAAPLPTAGRMAAVRAVTNSGAGAQADASQRIATFREFEKMMLTDFVSTMFQAGSESNGFDGTTGSVQASWFADAIAEQMIRRGGMGLADQLARLELERAPATAASAS